MAAEVHQLPVGRVLFMDERGVVLRATWHLERGIVNLSVWREDVCVETFWLGVRDSARLVQFLVDGLAEPTSGSLERPPQVSSEGAATA
ncbi:hypothetical protein BH18ACT1_BH18ACT1_16770 [soil metagenome]